MEDEIPEKKKKKRVYVYTDLNRQANNRWRQAHKLKAFNVVLDPVQYEEIHNIMGLTKCKTEKESFLLIFRAYRDMVMTWRK